MSLETKTCDWRGQNWRRRVIVAVFQGWRIVARRESPQNDLNSASPEAFQTGDDDGDETLNHLEQWTRADSSAIRVRAK